MILHWGNLSTSADFEQALRHGRDRVEALLAAGQRVRVGITGDPEDRIKRYGYPYSGMEPLWRTQSEKDVAILEAWLIEVFGSSLDNTAAGGGGDVQGPPYFLYVVH